MIQLQSEGANGLGSFLLDIAITVISVLLHAVSQLLITLYFMGVKATVTILTFTPVELPTEIFSVLTTTQYVVSIIAITIIPLVGCIYYFEDEDNIFTHDDFATGCLLYITATAVTLFLFRYGGWGYDFVSTAFAIDIPDIFTAEALQKSIRDVSSGWTPVYTLLLVPSVLSVIWLAKFSAARVVLLTVGVVFAPLLVGLRFLDISLVSDKWASRIERASTMGMIGIVFTHVYFKYTTLHISSQQSLYSIVLFIAYPVVTTIAIPTTFRLLQYVKNKTVFLPDKTVATAIIPKIFSD